MPPSQDRLTPPPPSGLAWLTEAPSARPQLCWDTAGRQSRRRQHPVSLGSAHFPLYCHREFWGHPRTKACPPLSLWQRKTTHWLRVDENLGLKALALSRVLT